MTEHYTEHWQVRKPAVRGDRGVVATQHYLASEVGAQVLRNGGNAVDAALTAGLAIGAVEPWMSGIGGGGYMTVYLAREDAVRVVEFGMRAPLEARPGDYPLARGTTGADTFNWPAVVDDANVEGPLAVATPGYVKGVALALETFGTLSWEEAIEPACRLAEERLPLDWYAAHRIASHAHQLARFEETRRVYLPDGLPRVAPTDGSVARFPLGNLASTCRRLQAEGPEDYYRGALARDIAADFAAVGSRIGLADLEDYSASLAEPLERRYRDARVAAPGHMTAGPSLLHALSLVEDHPFHGAAPDLDATVAYIEALRRVYDYRIEHVGEGDEGVLPTHTSHLCVADAEGNLVSLTQTVMSAFGARIMLPRTGILMNNGMMWFDPRPGRPNSVAGGRRPLCNMLPTVVRRDDGSAFALGASGGRRILASVFQLVSFVLDYGMDLDEAVHCARIDVSGNEEVGVMAHIAHDIVAAVTGRYPSARVFPNGVSPNLFACPQIVLRAADGALSGGAFVASPHARVAAA